MEFEFDTVITGAGISIDLPSDLPDGDQLARRAWLALFPDAETGALRSVCEDALPKRADADNGLRLEYLLEILSDPVGLDALMTVYRTLAASEPNLNHRMIAALPAHQHFTLNMDTLLEQASERRTWVLGCPMSPSDEFVHLHGRWDLPWSIKTTISQYLNRLPDDVRDRFVDAVEGRRVLVMGYSGRDFDVFPELVANPPARLVWLMHPGSSLVTEVEAELKRLETTGCQVEYPEATVADYLAAFTDRGAARRSVERAAEDHHRLRSAVDAIGPARARDRPDAELEAALAVVPLSKRALGAARVLFELGEFEQLDKLGLLRPCVGGDAALLRKVRARAQRRRGHNLRALCLLLQPPTSVDAARVVVGNVNEVANLLTRVGAPALGRAADRLLLHFASRRDSAPARRFALQSSVRIGQDLSVRGRLGDATRLLAGVVDAPDVRDVIGLSGEVDATTWLLDALKAQGRYRESLSLVEQMEPKAAYTNLSQRAYAYWQIGSVRLLAGQVSAARNSLQTARDVAAKSGDRQAHAWAVGTLSDAFRDDPAAGRAVLDEAAKAGRPVEELSNHYLAHQYLLLQLAEQSRVEGDLDAASRLVQRAARVRAPGRLRVREQSMNVLATRMIWLLLTAEQADDPSTWLLQAETLRSQYARLGASAAATDVSILLHKVAGHPIPPGVHDWGKDSWQSRWSNDAWQWRRPWHIIA